MTTEEFWQVIPSLAKRVLSDRDIEPAMHNFMCNNVYQSYGDCAEPFEDLSSPVAWELAVRFLNKYEEVKSTLHKKCYDLRGLERGDDGYGDLMDSLPLAGKDIVDGLMNDDIATYKQLQEAFTLKNDQPLKKFILNGENYICMKLEEKLQEAYLAVSRDLEDDDEDGCCQREDPHVVCVTTAGKEGYTLFGMQVRVRGPFMDRHEAEQFAKQQDEGTGIVVKLFGGVVKR